MTRVAIRFAYDGTLFDSFARQPHRRTVEGELLSALTRSGAIASARTARYGVASRTDRHVSAWGNVCALDIATEPRALAHRVELPDGLWLVSAAAIDDDFSPRSAATSRTYRYHVVEPDRLDWSLMQEAAQAFVGLHDFQNFCHREEGVSTRRRISEATVSRRQGGGVIRFRAPNFLWQQVRRMVHAILDVGSGTRLVESVFRQLEGAGRPEPPSVPEPLVLEDVSLPLTLPSPSRRFMDAIEERRLQALVRARFYSGFASSLPTMRR